MVISKELWQLCQICDHDIKSEKCSSGSYYTDAFKRHIEIEHNLTLEEYFEKTIVRPECECGTCGELVNISKRGANFRWRRFKCGLTPGVRRWAEVARSSMSGCNNPMHGKNPWNKGLTKEDNDSIMSTSTKMSNRDVSTETKMKQSDSAKSRLVHGHTGRKHSEISKDKMRLATLARIERGDFKHLRSIPHIQMCDILDLLEISYENEKIVEFWSFDIHLTDLNIYIEVDGDYFHSNPRTYSEPKTKTQKINFYRDQKKNKYCEDNGLRLIRFWEYDILNNQEQIKCELEKLNQ
jgi:very-short-patch-repair endonuclease